MFITAAGGAYQWTFKVTGTFIRVDFTEDVIKKPTGYTLVKLDAPKVYDHIGIYLDGKTLISVVNLPSQSQGVSPVNERYYDLKDGINTINISYPFDKVFILEGMGDKVGIKEYLFYEIRDRKGQQAISPEFVDEDYKASVTESERAININSGKRDEPEEIWLPNAEHTSLWKYQENKNGLQMSGINGIHPDSYASVAEIYIPKSFEGTINISTISRGIEFLGSFEGNKFSCIEAASTSGDVNINNMSITGDMILSSTSGDIKGEKVKANDVSLKSTSGNIELDELLASDIELKTTSGDIDVDRCTGSLLTAKSTSGDLEFGVISAEAITVGTTSGDIEIENATSADTVINSSSGDIELGLSKEMSFIFNSVCGDGVRIDTYFDEALTISSVYGERRAEATVGTNPQETVSVKSNSGDIKIRER
jgi:hypothetical protein